jgi:hypothetical protein
MFGAFDVIEDHEGKIEAHSCIQSTRPRPRIIPIG